MVGVIDHHLTVADSFVEKIVAGETPATKMSEK